MSGRGSDLPAVFMLGGGKSMVDRDELFRTLWLMEACLDAKEKRKENKRKEKKDYWRMKKAVRLKKQEIKRRLREEFPKEWWLHEIEKDGLQWGKPYFTILCTVQMWKLFRKVIGMLRCMAAEGRKDEVKEFAGYIKRNILFRRSKKKGTYQ